jgi:hypothetical protein
MVRLHILVALWADVWYPVVALPAMVGGWPSQQGAASLPSDRKKGGLQMVTHSDLIQLGILIVGIIALFFQVNKKK